MLRIVLWIAAACAVLLVALAVSRGVRFTDQPTPPAAEAPAAEEAAVPAAEAPPEPKIVEAPPAPAEADVQVQEDAAATGMTTMEPDPSEDPAAAPQAPPT